MQIITRKAALVWGRHQMNGEKINVCNGVRHQQRENSQTQRSFLFTTLFRHLWKKDAIVSPEQTNTNVLAANKKPVVIFLTGRAWIIGYRMWGTLLGRALAPLGVLCIVDPDYRNFPRVNIEGMVSTRCGYEY